MAKFKKFIAAADQTARIVVLGNPYIYLNYATVWQDSIDTDGVIVKKELQKASKRYDPMGVFQKQVPSRFKLFA